MPDLPNIVCMWGHGAGFGISKGTSRYVVHDCGMVAPKKTHNAVNDFEAELKRAEAQYATYVEIAQLGRGVWTDDPQSLPAARQPIGFVMRPISS